MGVSSIYISIVVLLTIPSDFVVPSPSKEPTHVLGDDIRLSCKYPNHTYPKGYSELQWYKDGHKLFGAKTANKYRYRKEGKLMRIKESSLGDRSVHKCFVKLIDSNDKSCHHLQYFNPFAQKCICFEV